jgi:peroxiredoxin Q/BCP
VKKKISIVLACLVVALALVFVQLRGRAADDDQPVKVGSKAPDFTLPSQDGKNVSLHDFIGTSPVVLYFYPKDETSVCTKEACSFRDNMEAFKNLQAVVIGVSADSVDSHKEFATKHNLPFILLSDSDNSLRKAYGVPKTMHLTPGRVTYVIDKDGIVKVVFSSQLQAEKHVQEALAGLKPEGDTK